MRKLNRRDVLRSATVAPLSLAAGCAAGAMATPNSDNPLWTLAVDKPSRAATPATANRKILHSYAIPIIPAAAWQLDTVGNQNDMVMCYAAEIATARRELSKSNSNEDSTQRRMAAIYHSNPSLHHRIQQHDLINKFCFARITDAEWSSFTTLSSFKDSTITRSGGWLLNVYTHRQYFSLMTNDTPVVATGATIVTMHMSSPTGVITNNTFLLTSQEQWRMAQGWYEVAHSRTTGDIPTNISRSLNTAYHNLLELDRSTSFPKFMPRAQQTKKQRESFGPIENIA